MEEAAVLTQRDSVGVPYLRTANGFFAADNHDDADVDIVRPPVHPDLFPPGGAPCRYAKRQTE
jgi:hypothetical protein